MATLKNNETTEKKKEFDTTPEGMKKDAKEYAKRDISTVIKVFEKITEVNPDFKLSDITEEIIATTLIGVKYDMINEARNNRPSYMSYFE